MPKILVPLPAGSVSIELIIGYNFERARLAKGWSQAEASDALTPLLGVLLRQGGVSTIERSGRGRRRSFSAPEVFAFARCFDRPLAWWFIPPPHWVGKPGPATEDHDRLAAVTVGSPAGWDAFVTAATEAAAAFERLGQVSPLLTAFASTTNPQRLPQLQETLLDELAPALDRQIREVAALVAQLEATTLVGALRGRRQPVDESQTPPAL